MLASAGVDHESANDRFPIGPLLSASDEITRVREHFLGAIMEVGSRPTTGLSPAQRTSRAKLVASLIRYAVAGRFPKNVSRPGRLAPTFVDHEGTRCAVAYLMEGAGAGGLVDRIVGSHNHAFVPALAKDAVVHEWLLSQGVSVEEAARIQPSYCYSSAEACICMAELDRAEDLLGGTLIEGGTRFRVDKVFKTETGVAVGDEVDTVIEQPDLDGVRMFAKGSNGGISVWVMHPFVDDDTLDVSACTASANDAPEPPQTLELAVVLDIANGAECASTLEDEDSEWTERGSCDGDGCSFSALPAHETGLLYALVAGLAIARRRRAQG